MKLNMKKPAAFPALWPGDGVMDVESCTSFGNNKRNDRLDQKICMYVYIQFISIKSNPSTHPELLGSVFMVSMDV